MADNIAVGQSLGNTAYWTAAVRALESERVDRLFSDPWAKRLAGEVGAAWIAQRAPESVAQIVLGSTQVEQALALELGEAVGTLLRETPQFHDGRWLFIPVRTARDAVDVKQLLQVKRRPKRAKA